MTMPGHGAGTRSLLTGISGSGDTFRIRGQEGDGTMLVMGMSVRGAMGTVAVALSPYRLLPYPGGLAVDAAPDGQRTRLKWAVDQAVHARAMATTGAPLGG